MVIVLDTNVLYNAFFEGSSNYWIWEALRKGDLTIAVTSDILDEYEEILERSYGSDFSQSVLDALTTLENIQYIKKYFFWRAIPQDPDDEKFFDCAIAANALYLVTDDGHFNHLKKGKLFPPIKVVTARQFYEIIHIQ
jgi:uncharacterized protein